MINEDTGEFHPMFSSECKIIFVRADCLIISSILYKISLVSASGQSVKKITYNAASTGTVSLAISTASIPGGTYVLTVNGNSQQFSKPIVIENK